MCRCILSLCKARWRDLPLERLLSAFSGICLLLRARVLEWALVVWQGRVAAWEESVLVWERGALAWKRSVLAWESRVGITARFFKGRCGARGNCCLV